LASTILRSLDEQELASAGAVRYVCVERSESLRAEAHELLGSRAEVRADPPREVADGLVIANELLDNLPIRIVERTAAGWSESFVEDGAEVLGPTDLAPGIDVAPGTRLPVHQAAASWVRAACASLRRGRVIAFDYGVERTAELVDRSWLRTYHGHARGSDPFADPGSRDITVDVAFDQLPTPSALRTQAEFLRSWGIDDLVEEGRRVWHERAHLGDLAAIRARSRVTEADALLDPAGLGAFLVAEWVVSR
jgi:SAM-dependent MidA family methyltransferase